MMRVSVYFFFVVLPVAARAFVGSWSQSGFVRSRLSLPRNASSSRLRRSGVCVIACSRLGDGEKRSSWHYSHMMGHMALPPPSRALYTAGLVGPLRKSWKEMSAILKNAGWPYTIPAHTW